MRALGYESTADSESHRLIPYAPPSMAASRHSWTPSSNPGEAPSSRRARVHGSPATHTSNFQCVFRMTCAHIAACQHVQEHSDKMRTCDADPPPTFPRRPARQCITSNARTPDSLASRLRARKGGSSPPQATVLTHPRAYSAQWPPARPGVLRVRKRGFGCRLVRHVNGL